MAMTGWTENGWGDIKSSKCLETFSPTRHFWQRILFDVQTDDGRRNSRHRLFAHQRGAPVDLQTGAAIRVGRQQRTQIGHDQRVVAVRAQIAQRQAAGQRSQIGLLLLVGHNVQPFGRFPGRHMANVLVVGEWVNWLP